MSDNMPQRPEGLNDSPGTQPRVQVEPTPAQPQETTVGQTTQMPGSVSGAGAHAASSAGAAPASDMMSRTVVKTKTKKFPVFVSSLAGLAVGAVSYMLGKKPPLEMTPIEVGQPASRKKMSQQQ